MFRSSFACTVKVLWHRARVRFFISLLASCLRVNWCASSLQSQNSFFVSSSNPLTPASSGPIDPPVSGAIREQRKRKRRQQFYRKFKDSRELKQST
mmetsp:Transcript_35679/g.70303  ORF Transcript_35679/g.70303 Transcript_35679/m.70303 type:complete len:96 (+) Transcript_35679:933-1220(+)